MLMYILVWTYTYASYDIAPKLKITLLYTNEMQNLSQISLKKCDGYVHFCLFIVAVPHDIAPRLKSKSSVYRKKNVKSTIYKSKQCGAYVHFCLFMQLSLVILCQNSINSSCIQKQNAIEMQIGLQCFMLVTFCDSFAVSFLTFSLF